MMKKIVYIHQYYRRPDEPGTSRSHWVATHLIDNGYKVVLIAQKNSFNPENKNAPLFERVKFDNFDVIYIKNAYSNKYSIIRKVWAFLYFMITSTYYTLKEKKIDLIIATSTPISVGFPSLAAKYLKKTNYIFEVRDLWPEVPIDMGILKNSFLIKFSKSFIKKTYRNASHIIALSPGMASGIAPYGENLRIEIIPNMAKIDYFFPRDKAKELNKEFDLQDNSFKIIHFGTMGSVNGLSNFVEAAHLVKEKNIKDIEFILVGSGKQKAAFQNYKSSNHLDNLKIFDRMPLIKVSSLVNNCDISYVGVSKYKILEINSANKFFDSLSAGKPIIINFGGWMKDIIEKENCGTSVKNDDPEDLLNTILRFKNDEALRQQMGINARKLAETTYDKSILCKKVRKVVDTVVYS